MEPVLQSAQQTVEQHRLANGRLHFGTDCQLQQCCNRFGERVLGLQQGLANRVRELEDALGQVKELKGLLPICCYCKAVRDDRNYWHRVGTYITAHSAARFSHGICPGCWKDVVEPQLVPEAPVVPKPKF